MKDKPIKDSNEQDSSDWKKKIQKRKLIQKESKEESKPQLKNQKVIKSEQTVSVPQTKKSSLFSQKINEKAAKKHQPPFEKKQEKELDKFTPKKPLDEDEKFKSGKYKIKDVGTKKGSRAEPGSKVTKRLSIVAWNVWKEGHNLPNSNMENRYNEIVRIITAKNPDIICLQQIEKFTERHLLQFINSFKGSQYYFPDPQLRSFNSSIVLCKYPAKFYEVKYSKGFKTKPMTICEFKINCSDGKTRSVIAHSVHLKARSNNHETQKTRLFQLELISKINGRYDISVAAGDFNIDDSHPQNKQIKYNFLDLQSHHKNPRQVEILPQNQPQVERTDIRYSNFSSNLLHQYEHSEDSEDSEDQMMSEYESQDSFDGYSESFYDDSQRNDEFSSSSNSDSQSEQEDDSEHDSYDSFEEQECQSEDGDDSDADDCGSDQGYHWRQRFRPPSRAFRRRIISKPDYQRPSRGREFRQVGDRRRHYERVHRRREERQRNRLPPPHLIPTDNPNNTWTFMHFNDKSMNRFDRILMGCSQLQKTQFKKKVNVVQFQRLGNYSVGIHSTTNFMAFLYDHIVRSPSDHLGVYAVLFLNYKQI